MLKGSLGHLFHQQSFVGKMRKNRSSLLVTEVFYYFVSRFFWGRRYVLHEIHTLMQNTNDQNTRILGYIKHDMGLVFKSL